MFIGMIAKRAIRSRWWSVEKEIEYCKADHRSIHTARTFQMIAVHATAGLHTPDSIVDRRSRNTQSGAPNA